MKRGGFFLGVPKHKRLWLILYNFFFCDSNPLPTCEVVCVLCGNVGYPAVYLCSRFFFFFFFFFVVHF